MIYEPPEQHESDCTHKCSALLLYFTSLKRSNIFECVAISKPQLREEKKCSQYTVYEYMILSLHFPQKDIRNAGTHGHFAHICLNLLLIKFFNNKHFAELA